MANPPKKTAKKPEPELSPKMFVVPALLMIVKFFKLDFTLYVPQLRAGYACAVALTVLTTLMCGQLAQKKQEPGEVTVCVEINQCMACSFSAMTRPSWFGRAVGYRHRHAIEQASRRWRGGRRDDSARTRRKI